MLLKNILILVLLFLKIQSGVDNSFFQYRLYDLDNKLVTFAGQNKFKATVVVFFLTDCPASQSYTLTLNKLSKKFSPDSIQFLGVFPGKFSTENEMLDFR